MIMRSISGTVNTITVRLTGEAVALGLCPEPEVFLEMLATEWIAARRSRRSSW